MDTLMRNLKPEFFLYPAAPGLCKRNMFRVMYQRNGSGTVREREYNGLGVVTTVSDLKLDRI